METKVNLCRVKVHCLSFMRTIVRTYLLRNSCSKLTAFNQISHFAFLFYEFQRPRLDFSGGYRGGARGASPPLIFRLKWGPKGQKKFFWSPPPPLPLTASATWFDRLPSGQSERRVIKILEGIFFQLYSCWFFWKLVQKNDKRVWDLPSLHNTRYFFYVSQESEGNLSARHAMTGAIEVRQAVKGNYSVYRVSSLCFSAVNSLGGPLWKFIKNLNKFN